jgi:hypothetical protein
MGLLKRLFADGAGQKKNLTARAGYALALEALQATHPMEADRAYLCCVYTSAADANVVLEKDGTSRGWHFDFFLPASRTLYLVRVQNGKTRGKQMPWQKTQKSPVEYVYAMYGMAMEQVSLVEPPRIPDDWLDSPFVTAVLQEALEPHGGRAESLELATLCLPAEHLRYLQEDKVRNLLSLPPAPRDSFAAICSPEDPYAEDSYLLYIQATTGEVLETFVFRFPNLFYFGTSRNW